MTAKEAYNIAVHRIEDIDKKIAELYGKSDAYNEMRQVSFEMMTEEEKEEGKKWID